MSVLNCARVNGVTRKDIIKLAEAYDKDPTGFKSALDKARKRKKKAMITAEMNAQKTKEFIAYLEGRGNTKKAGQEFISNSGQAKAAGIVPLEQKVYGFQNYYNSRTHEIAELLRPRAGGGARNKKLDEDYGRALFGDTHGPDGKPLDPMAVKAAGIGRKTIEEMRLKRNELGSDIAKREDYGMPVYHDPMRIGLTSKEEWIQTVKNNFNMEYLIPSGTKDRDNLLNRFLESVYYNIKSDGIKDIDVKLIRPVNRKQVSQWHKEHRLLQPISGDSYVNYMKQFGSESFYESYARTIDSDAKEIALMDTLGPTPDRVIEAGARHIKQKTGEEPRSMLHEYAEVTGAGRNKFTPAGRIVQSIKTGMAAVKLPLAVISSSTDLFLKSYTAKLLGMPFMESTYRSLRQLTPLNRSTRSTVLQIGFQTGFTRTRMLNTANRYFMQGTQGKMGRMLDRVMKFSGLDGWTRRIRESFIEDMMINLGRAFDNPGHFKPKNLSKFMSVIKDRYGFTAKELDTMKATARYTNEEGLDLFDPTQLEPELAARVIGMVLEEMMYAVPTPNAHVLATMNKVTAERGTGLGELTNSIWQFKSFPVTMTMTHIRRAWNHADNAHGRIYNYGALFTGLTVMGYLNLQAKELINGRTPRKLDWKMTADSIMQGGVGGLALDFMLSSPDDWAEQGLGPLLSESVKAGNLIFGGWGRIINDEAKFNDVLARKGVEAVRFVKGITPYRLPYLRAVMDRGIFDYAEDAINPNARSYRRKQARRMKKKKGQEFWVKPGLKGVGSPQVERIVTEPARVISENIPEF